MKIGPNNPQDVHRLLSLMTVVGLFALLWGQVWSYARPLKPVHYGVNGPHDIYKNPWAGLLGCVSLAPDADQRFSYMPENPGTDFSCRSFHGFTTS